LIVFMLVLSRQDRQKHCPVDYRLSVTKSGITTAITLDISNLKLTRESVTTATKPATNCLPEICHSYRLVSGSLAFLFACTIILT
jgi:hypothetical protein